MAAILVSYAREDQPFVRFLHDTLDQNGHDVWVDWQGIPPSADYLPEIERAIDAASWSIRRPKRARSPVR